MTYLRILALLDRILRSLMRRCDPNGWLWAELADRDGHVAFRQIDYAKRVQKASGWEPVEVGGWRPWMHHVTPNYPLITTTTGANTTVRFTYPETSV